MKLMIFAENTGKTKVRSPSKIFIIWLMLAVIFRQRLFHENEIMLYFLTTNAMKLTEAILESAY